MKISKTYLQHIIKEELFKQLAKEELLKELMGPPKKPPTKIKPKAKPKPEERKIIFKFLLNGSEHVYEDYDVKEILNKKSFYCKPDEMRGQMYYDFLYALSDHPDLNKEITAIDKQHQQDGLLKSHINMYGEEMVKYIYDLAKNNDEKSLKNVPLDRFEELCQEYKYTDLARDNVVVRSFYWDRNHKYAAPHSQLGLNSRRSLLFALDNIKGFQFPTTAWGKFLKTETLKKALFSDNPEEQKKYNGFFPISLWFTDVLVDTVENKYKDCSIAYYNGKEELEKAKSISASLKKDLDVGGSIIDNLNSFINNLTKK